MNKQQSTSKVDLTDEFLAQEMTLEGIKYHRHRNGGGWVSEKAQVDETVWVGVLAFVHNGVVKDNVTITDRAVVYNGVIKDNVVISDRAVVNCSGQQNGEPNASGSVHICGLAKVFGLVMLSDLVRVSGSAKVFGTVRLSGSIRIFGSAMIFDKKRKVA